ncbi:DNA cytosine methyltransferase [Selenomonas sp. AE3005]|uniref:DNA cytosine methyltransferase n=1 Tax=Selenomonas sp. AE3005 TaxID=1485543 RepID=UPI0025E46602|nr:DNA cytosine methyltransferase [Selenomonas sp. AE3005]
MEFKIIENHPNDSRVKYKEDGVFQTLSSRMGTGGGNVPMVHSYCIARNTIDRQPQNGGNGAGNQEELAYTLNTVDRHAVSNEKTVRRLTPLEAERLQGLPDSWTDIEYKGKPAPDSKRYKALGNGMAQPCADYVIRRIVEVNK